MADDRGPFRGVRNAGGEELAHAVAGDEASRFLEVDITKRHFRFRRVDVAPGGFVPLHGHANRPAIIVIAAGAITEYSTRAAAPKVRRAGDILAGYGDVWHGWHNAGREPVVIYAADLVDPADIRPCEC